MQKMKYSGVEWIGEIPEDWEVKKNKYILSNMYSGGTPTANKPELYSDEGTPFVSIGDMSETDYVCDTKKKLSDLGVKEKNLKILPAGTIIYSIYATIGAVSELKIQATISQALLALSINNQVIKSWYKYNLNAMRDYICFSANGNTQFNLNAEKVWNFSFVIPPIDTQHRIADFLDDKCGKIDRYIEKQQRTIDKLKEYKQAFITEAVTKGLDPDAPMKDSGIEWIGMIPEHWEVPEIKYLVRIASGGTPDRNHPEYWNGNIPWIKTGELQNDIITNAEEYITEEGLNNSSAQVFNINTILVAMYGQGKTRGMTALLKIPASTNQACAGLTVTNSNVQIEYLWQCLIGAYDAIRSEAAGSGQPNLSATLIGNFHIALPPIEEQGLIVEYIKDRTVEIKSTIHKAEKLLEKLTEYKKSLIYEAVTGKKEV